MLNIKLRQYPMDDFAVGINCGTDMADTFEFSFTISWFQYLTCCHHQCHNPPWSSFIINTCEYRSVLWRVAPTFGHQSDACLWDTRRYGIQAGSHSVLCHPNADHARVGFFHAKYISWMNNNQRFGIRQCTTHKQFRLLYSLERLRRTLEER